mgnify:CR=1 FL=1
MNIILFSRRHGQLWNSDINLTVTALGFVLLLVLTGAVSLYAGLRLADERPEPVADWQGEMHRYQADPAALALHAYLHRVVNSRDSAALQASAERRVKLGVLLSEIVRHNQIQVDPDRVRRNIETIAASYENPDEVVQYYYGNQEMLTGVQTAVIEEQAVEWIMENSGVTVEDKPSTFDELVDAAKQSKG